MQLSRAGRNSGQPHARRGVDISQYTPKPTGKERGYGVQVEDPCYLHHAGALRDCEDFREDPLKAAFTNQRPPLLARNSPCSGCLIPTISVTAEAPNSPKQQQQRRSLSAGVPQDRTLHSERLRVSHASRFFSWRKRKRRADEGAQGQKAPRSTELGPEESAASRIRNMAGARAILPPNRSGSLSLRVCARFSCDASTAAAARAREQPFSTAHPGAGVKWHSQKVLSAANPDGGSIRASREGRRFPAAAAQEGGLAGKQAASTSQKESEGGHLLREEALRMLQRTAEVEPHDLSSWVRSVHLLFGLKEAATTTAPLPSPLPCLHEHLAVTKPPSASFRYERLRAAAPEMLRLVRFLRPAEAAMLAHHASHFFAARKKRDREDRRERSLAVGVAGKGLPHHAQQRRVPQPSPSREDATAERSFQNAWWNAFCKAALGILQDADGRETAVILAAIAASQTSQTELVSLLLAEAEAWAAENSPRNNALIRRIGSTGCCEAATAAICKSLREKQEQLNAIDCCMSIHGAARLGLKDPAFYEDLLTRAEALLPQMNEHNLSMIVWGMGEVGVRQLRFLASAAEHLLRICDARGVAPHYAAPILWGFSRLSFASPSVLRFVDGALRKVDRMQALDVCITCTASPAGNSQGAEAPNKLGGCKEEGIWESDPACNVARTAAAATPTLPFPLLPFCCVSLLARVRAGSTLDSSLSVSAFWTPLGRLLAAGASRLVPRDAANVALCFQRLHHRQRSRQQGLSLRAESVWIAEFFKRLNDAVTEGLWDSAALRDAANAAFAAASVDAAAATSANRFDAETPTEAASLNSPAAALTPLLKLALALFYREQKEGGTASPQDVTRLLGGLALSTPPAVPCTAAAVAAAADIAESAAANKHLYSRKQQHAVAEALMKLGLQPDGLRDWLESFSPKCRRREAQELVAADGEAEVYVQLDEENPILKETGTRHTDTDVAH
ncbi:hypothetical protein cyc_06849 [Cyclospora cayetanensis]|uniref:Uncharacterized protein n=1 Tax=Cyclospora cayetanensis TaxID=88456 RepID=A0A1D3CUC6_9EIME|nr:hypothetical protein cyc_06849 [Cyclospora cayetanensis]